MSALTFQDLSTELTQAIEIQLDTPSGTKARCTLGREKVMVLVEYPSQSGHKSEQAEPLADSTLDWLEQSLREQFDTVGLPEEVADLTETGEVVAVQLFLKHTSEPKPFTARSFTWKVADGFDDLFGDSPSSEDRASDHASISQASTGSLASSEADTDSINAVLDLDEYDSEQYDSEQYGSEQDGSEQYDLADRPLDLPLSDAALEDLASEEDSAVSDLENTSDTAEEPAPVEVELKGHADATFLSLSAIETLDSEIFSLPGEEPAIPAASSDLDLPTVDLPISHTEGGHPSDDGFFDMSLEDEGYNPSAATDRELAADFESALDSSSARLTSNETESEIELNEDIFDELLTPDAPAFEDLTSELIQDSDIETWRSLSARASVPNSARQTTAPTSLDADTSAAASQASSANGASPSAVGLEETSLEENIGDRGTIGLGGDNNADVFEDRAEPGEDIFEADEDEAENWQSNADLDLVAEINEDADSIAIAPEEPAPEEPAAPAVSFNEYGFDEYGFDEYGSDEYGADDDNPDELEADQSENDQSENDHYERDTESSAPPHDERYQLEQLSAEDASDEEVALIDEGEVQAQREQWQQQTKGNPWFFAGAIGFFAVGLLGFVLTRPCSFGACPRIETAQAEGERALSDLTLGADLKAVTAAKQQLNQSVRSLQPIPFWSSYYSQAQAVLPKFEGQLSALDRVSAAQAQAYQAALASQNPPHSSSKWEEIASQWREAIATLESVPTDNSVRRLANRKLTEYRANLSTIKVRIEAEANAETSLSGAQQAATIATATAKQAKSFEDWESSLENWELAIERLDQIPQGTLAYSEAQALRIDYRKQLETVRDRTLQEGNASRNLSSAKQLASDAQRVASDDQWTLAVQTWNAAIRQLEDIATGTTARAEAQPLISRYQQSLEKAENNRQVSLRFQPVEPSFYAACGATTTQKCTYSVSSGNVRLNLLQDYDRAINQSITPPDQRGEIDIDSGVVSQSNQLLKEITLLSTQAQVPIELYDAKGEFLARYRPDLNGFVKDRET